MSAIVAINFLWAGGTVASWPTSGGIASAKFKLQNCKYLTFIKSQVKYIKIKLNVLLIQPLCQISKRLYGESTPCDYLWTAPRKKSMKNIFQPGRCATKVRNSDKINALPLMIFFCWHSKRSQIHHKWSFCSIMSFFISINTLYLVRFSQ